MSDVSGPFGGGVVTYRLRINPSRSMKSVTRDVEALLGEFGESSQRSGGLLASELIAQVIGREPGWGGEPVALTIQMRDDSVRLEAMGPVVPLVDASNDANGAPDERLADWGRYLMDRLADRWGVDGGPRRDIWAEIEVPSPPVAASSGGGLAG
jgi:hypothetical protein